MVQDKERIILNVFVKTGNPCFPHAKLHFAHPARLLSFVELHHWRPHDERLSQGCLVSRMCSVWLVLLTQVHSFEKFLDPVQCWAPMSVQDCREGRQENWHKDLTPGSMASPMFAEGHSC